MNAAALGSETVTDGSRTQYNLGPLSQIPVGEGRAFAVNGEQIAVFRLRDGQVRALSAVCPHRGGPIADGTIDASVVICPLHLNAFSLDTGCSLTGEAALRSYAVRVDDDAQLVLEASLQLDDQARG